MMRVKAEAQAKEFNLKIPGNSLSQVFEILRGVTMQRWGSTDSWRINLQREGFALWSNEARGSGQRSVCLSCVSLETAWPIRVS